MTEQLNSDDDRSSEAQCITYHCLYCRTEAMQEAPT